MHAASFLPLSLSTVLFGYKSINKEHATVFFQNIFLLILLCSKYNNFRNTPFNTFHGEKLSFVTSNKNDHIYNFSLFVCSILLLNLYSDSYT